MLKVKMHIEHPNSFREFTITIFAKYHLSIQGKVINGIPIECDDDAYIEILHLEAHGIRCSIEKVAEWIDMPVEELEDRIREHLLLNIDDLPF